MLVIETKTERLRDFPGIGTPRDDIRPGSRTLMHDAHLIAYEHEKATDQVEIVAVVEGMRDLDRLF